MSLVRQALARAEREAAAREAREKGLPENLATAGQPWRAPRRRAPLGAIAAGALALAAAAGLGYRLSRANVVPATVAAPAPPAAPPAPATASPPAAAAVAASPAPAPAPPTPAPAVAPRPEPAAPPRVASPAPAAVDEIVVRELPLDGGRRLALGGIAWSEAAPLAYLDGRLVGVGESVAGYRVARIERDRVRLEKAGRAVVLLLRTAP